MRVLPEASEVWSMPTLMSMDFIALLVMLFISLCRNELSALFIENPPVLPSARYIPVVSMVTAALPRCSTLMAASSFFIVMSSGASRVNSSPMSCSVFVTFTPQSKSTVRLLPDSEPTFAFTRSVAVMFRRGFITLPVNSM